MSRLAWVLVTLIAVTIFLILLHYWLGEATVISGVFVMREGASGVRDA
jgi:hypothetical protein